MARAESELALLRIPQFAALATSAWPAWLWGADASRMSPILGANAIGAALLGAADVAACRRLPVDPRISDQVKRIAATLPVSGQPRLERLRGLGLGFGAALTCACSRLALVDGTVAVLVAAVEPAGPALTLDERVRRLFADDASALAVFAPEGALIHATEAARNLLGTTATLQTLGIEPLAARALEAGRASGHIRLGSGDIELTMIRLGEGLSRVLVLIYPSSTRDHLAATSAAIAAATLRVTPSQPASSAAAPHDEAADRRHPLRFVWQMDAEGRFVVGSDEFIELIGPRTTAAFGRLWSEIATALELDPENQVTRAIATRETWSGIGIAWPVDESSERLPVELSGLPVFDRDRNFCGYRGFGICRDIGRLNELRRVRRERPLGFLAAPEPREELPSMPVEGSAKPAAAEATAAEAAQETPPPADRAAERAGASAPPAANVVPFRPSAETKAPSLSPVERKAFRDLAQELTARLRGAGEAARDLAGGAEMVAEASQPTEPGEAAARAPGAAALIATDSEAGTHAMVSIEPGLLDHLPIGILVYRHDALLYANRCFLDWSGYDSLDALAAAGGLDALFVEPRSGAVGATGGGQALSIMTRRGDEVPLDGHLATVSWNGALALALILGGDDHGEGRARAAEQALATAQGEIRDLTATLDKDMAERDKTASELRNIRREAQKTVATKAEFLAKVSHEIRTPLNAIAGFAEVMMSERFGPVGNERYREYLKDIQTAGTHLASLINDLLDLSKIETGQLDLTFTNVNLNELTQQCVSIMQPQANRARIIIRSALTPKLPLVIADERTLRQIVLNLLANSIRFTGPGGQVIVSTLYSDAREVLLRVRDTSAGMSERDIEAALEPFRQTATAGSWGSGGTGLGLPLTKALAEANHANFSIKSGPDTGTLIEIGFPQSRVLGD